MSGSKIKLGLYWAASCGGCDISILEIHEKILDALEAVEIVFWPCVMDFKYADLEAMDDGFMDLCLFNGAIRNEENRHIARLLRRKSKVLVAHGACASMGGIPGLANLSSNWSMFERVYGSTESTVNLAGVLPDISTLLPGDTSIELPSVLDCVKSLHHVVKVDYTIPGCPPTGRQNWAVLEAVVTGNLPEPGSVIGAGDKSVCDECRFERSDGKVKEFIRPHQVIPDPESCLLEQGILCMGPATRSGCRASCLSANMPCRGCYGPAQGVTDQGAKMVAMIGSIIDSDDEEEIARAIETIADPVGTFYRFGLPGSIMGRSKS